MSIEPGSAVGNYRILNPLGTGGTASVWCAVHLKTGVNVAIKIFEKNAINQEKFFREVKLHQSIENPLISSLFDVLEDDDFYYVVVELAERGNFVEMVNNLTRIPEEKAKQYFAQLIFTIEYLHENGIAHRDIKCENIMVDKYDNIKLIDFGLSKSFTDENNFMSTPCGTAPYAAPELIRGELYTAKTDIWSCGIWLYTIVCGILPFQDQTHKKLMNKILYSDPAIPQDLSSNLFDMISRLLCKNPKNRITIEEIKNHPWFPRNEYIILSKFTKIVSSQNLDSEIVEQMIKYGFDVSHLEESLKNKELNDLTASYKMLLTARIKEKLHTKQASSMSNLKTGAVSFTTVIVARRKSRGAEVPMRRVLSLTKPTFVGNDNRKSLLFKSPKPHRMSFQRGVVPKTTLLNRYNITD